MTRRGPQGSHRRSQLGGLLLMASEMRQMALPTSPTTSSCGKYTWSTCAAELDK